MIVLGIAGSDSEWQIEGDLNVLHYVIYGCKTTKQTKARLI